MPCVFSSTSAYSVNSVLREEGWIPVVESEICHVAFVCVPGILNTVFGLSLQPFRSLLVRGSCILWVARG
jgi:hypothetical protein